MFPPKGLNIRKLTAADLPALEWDGAYTHFRRVYAEAYQFQQKGKSVLWVAELPSVGVIGQAFVQLLGARPELADGFSRAYIYSVRVRPPYRNLGIGSRLMQTAEANLVAFGFAYATLNVSKENPMARQLYERLGYRVIADEPGDWSYLDHRGRRRTVHEPSWRMEKTLRR